MARTLSTRQPDPDMPADIDGSVVDGVEALRQRVLQAIRFQLGEWFLRRRAGVPYANLIGHRTGESLAASTITAAIRLEGGAEITAISEVRTRLDPSTREFFYFADCQTIYGPMAIETGGLN